jgi:hypothetical protein
MVEEDQEPAAAAPVVVPAPLEPLATPTEESPSACSAVSKAEAAAEEAGAGAGEGFRLQTDLTQHLERARHAAKLQRAAALQSATDDDGESSTSGEETSDDDGGAFGFGLDTSGEENLSSSSAF